MYIKKLVLIHVDALRREYPYCYLLSEMFKKLGYKVILLSRRNIRAYTYFFQPQILILSHSFTLNDNILKSFSDTTINFEITDNKKINLKTDNGEYSISYLDAEEYPEIPTFPTDEDEINEFQINGLELKNAFDTSSFAMSKEEMRPAMMGTLLEFNEEVYVLLLLMVIDYQIY